MAFSDKVGKRLRKVRESTGLTQLELGKAAGVGANYVPRVERGELVPSLEAGVRLCKVLGISLDELCGVASEPSVGAWARLKRADAAVLRKVAEVIEQGAKR